MIYPLNIPPPSRHVSRELRDIGLAFLRDGSEIA